MEIAIILLLVILEVISMSLTNIAKKHPVITKIHDLVDEFVAEILTNDQKLVQANELAKKSDELNTKFSEKTTELQQLEQKIIEIQQTLDEKTKSLLNLTEKIQIGEKNLAELTEKLKVIKIDLAQLQEQVQKTTNIHNDLQLNHSALLVQHKIVGADLESAKTYLQDVQNATGVAEVQHNEHVEKAMVSQNQLAGDIESLSQDKITLESSNKLLVEDNINKKSIIDGIDNEISTKKDVLNDFISKIEQAKTEFQSIATSSAVEQKKIQDDWDLLSTEKKLVESTQNILNDKFVILNKVKEQINESIGVIVDSLPEEIKMGVMKGLQTLNKL